MIEIRVYTMNGTTIKSLGTFEPEKVEDVLKLLRAYQIEDIDGGIEKVECVRFDVGVSPHIAVHCIEDNSGAEPETKEDESPF